MKYLSGEQEKIAKNWMVEASEIAKGALCLKAKCGTVIVNNGEIIGKGYNAPPLDDIQNRTCLDEHQSFKKPNYDRTCCMHAEWRAIIDGLKNNQEKMSGSSLYFSRVGEDGKIKKSGQPYCTVCSRFALDVGIKYFLLWQEEGIAEYETDEYNRLSYEFHRN
ncbi:MAG: hypothetical protein WAX44_02075 [Minisyncoccia bacterium]